MSGTVCFQCLGSTVSCARLTRGGFSSIFLQIRQGGFSSLEFVNCGRIQCNILFGLFLFDLDEVYWCYRSLFLRVVICINTSNVG